MLNLLSTIYPPCLKKNSTPTRLKRNNQYQEALSLLKKKNQTALQNDSSLKGKQQTKFYEHEDDFSVRDYSPDNLSLHPYAALLAERKPAEIVLDSLKGVPIGTPLEEIKRASNVFGLDFNFMRTIAKIEF